MLVFHNGSFGRRMLKRELAKIDIHYSEYKISRIMKYLQLEPKYGRKKLKNVHTSDKTEKYIHDNIYKTLTPYEKENLEIWSMDFTEQKVQGKKIFTCGIISVNKKLIVGFSIGRSCNTKLACEALCMAIEKYGAPYLIMTDRGSAFTSKLFFDILQKHNVIHSMSRPHKPADNIFIETFWKSMKIEIGKLTLLDEYQYIMVVTYYMHYYNFQRPHSSIGYLTPIEYTCKKLSFNI